MTNRIKYVLHPGYETSKTDGQQHFIKARQLAELYRVDPRECVVYNSLMHQAISYQHKLIHLHPDYYGNYELKG